MVGYFVETMIVLKKTRRNKLQGYILNKYNVK